jgi:hypothetical protein
MNQLRETCHCGHDRASHYRDLSSLASDHTTCLCPGCACELYVNEFEPKPPKVPTRPAGHPLWCQCHHCKQVAA